MTAAIKATTDAGYRVTSIEVDKEGKIIVHTGIEQDTPPAQPVPERNEWDDA